MADTRRSQPSEVAKSFPLIEIRGGRATTTSLAIAEYFGKEHKDVLRKIRSIESEVAPEMYQRNFALIQITVDLGDGRSRKDPAFELTRDGFTLLAMGFTGKQALAWKVKYIEAFNAMEAHLHAEAPKEQPALPGKRVLSATLRQAIDRKAHAINLQHYDTLRDTLTRLVEETYQTRGEAAALGALEAYRGERLELVDRTLLDRIAAGTLVSKFAHDHILALIHDLENRLGREIYRRELVPKRTTGDTA